MNNHVLFGSFHIIAASISVLAAVVAARLAADFVLQNSKEDIYHMMNNCVSQSDHMQRPAKQTQSCGSGYYNYKENSPAILPLSSNKTRLALVFKITGLVLLALELFKQIYLYFSAGVSDYDWWYFPFQLCSVPMYLCILLSFGRYKLHSAPTTNDKKESRYHRAPIAGCRKRIRSYSDFVSDLQSAFLTFMGGYTFIGAVAALIYPEDILSAAPVMTLHGFLWHAILLFISVLIFITGSADASAAGLARAALLFAVLSLIAVAINVVTEPVMQANNAIHSYAAMFYLNPYHISPQPIVSSIQKTAGIPAGLLLYSLATPIVASICNVISARIFES